jgi:hypothetical protein
VLFLVADEILTPAVKREIDVALPCSIHQGFLPGYTNYFLGRRLRGGYPCTSSPSSVLARCNTNASKKCTGCSVIWLYLIS